MRLRLNAPLLLLCALAASPLARIFASAALVNVTIDDTFGDESNGDHISYEPPGLWSVGQDCTACTAHPDPELAFNGSWHDSTYNETQSNDPSVMISSAAARFEGTAVYVFCIVTRSSVSPDGNSDMSFFIDGQLVGAFVQPPNGDTAYEYNVPVYVNESLPAGIHTIAIVNGQSGANRSLVLLDYIVYTHEVPDPTPPPSSSAPPSAVAHASVPSLTSVQSLAADTGSANTTQKRTIIIAVATVCGVIGLAIIIIVVSYCCLRRRRNSYSAPSDKDVIPRSPSHIEVNPATSGWAEGTWAVGGEDTPHSATTPTSRLGGVLSQGQRKMSGRRKRGGSDSRATSSADTPTATPSPSRSPHVPPAILSAIPTFRFSPRADPPGSPASSSWGTPASMAPPDSATYLMAPSMTSSTSNLNLQRAYQDTGGSSTTLSSHNAHPFAKAHGVESAPLGRSRSGTTRSAAGGASHQHSHPQPPPSAMPSSFYTRPRGYSNEKVPRFAEPPESSLTSPITPPSAPYTLDSDESFLPSPSPADPSPLSSLPNRELEQQQEQSLRPSASQRRRQQQQEPLRPSPSQSRRRVDPVDPSFQPPRDAVRPLRVRGAGTNASANAHAPTQSESSRSRQPATTLFARDRRRRYGTVDVPVDASDSQSWPASSREGG